MASTLYDLAVVGGGPAGAAAALQAGRLGLSVCLISDKPGGQLKSVRSLDNLTLAPKTSGAELAELLQLQLGQLGISTRPFAHVESLDHSAPIKTLTLSTEEIIQCKTLVIATGSQWQELQVPGSKEFLGHGVAYCPHCDGPYFSEKDVAVVGGGDLGLKASIYLSQVARSVTLFESQAECSANPQLLHQAQRCTNIQIFKESNIQEILGENGKVNALSYTSNACFGSQTIAVSAVFVQLGSQPNNALAEGRLHCNDRGEIIINSLCQTNEAGIFACGDVTDTPYKQVITAAAEGAKAGFSAHFYLQTNQS